ncbi:MAG: hypothetical protein H7Y38_12465 [Armatimonadetes bacterium]|nr:hypothetical protein [Armatimonadota bacterium]
MTVAWYTPDAPESDSRKDREAPPWLLTAGLLRHRKAGRGEPKMKT